MTATRFTTCMQELGSEPGIQRIRIFNRDGRIMFSTETREIDTAVDKSAEACYGCHAQSQPLTKLNRPDRARPLHGQAGPPPAGRDPAHRQHAGMLQRGVPRARCRPAGAGRDGRALSLAPVDAQIAHNQATLGWFLLGGILLGSGVAVAFIWRVVYRPVKELIDGTHRVARGRPGLPPARALGRRTGRPGRQSFNKMTARGGRGAGQDRGAGAAQDGRTGAHPPHAAELGKDGFHRQAGRHRGARDQQSAVRHPDLRAAGAARAC